MAKQPVLSIWQPWASLVASGEKTIETRLEEAPEELIGKRIYIHSSTITSRSHVYDWLESRYPDAMKNVYAKYSRQDLPTAMVIATAVLSECRKTDWRDWPSTIFMNASWVPSQFFQSLYRHSLV